LGSQDRRAECDRRDDETLQPATLVGRKRLIGDITVASGEWEKQVKMSTEADSAPVPNIKR
jgi:hypothetical protein